MFRLTQCTPVGGDATCGYYVELEKEYTVKEFIETVLNERKNEWGFFNIKGSLSCEYRYGELVSDTGLQEIGHRKINKVSASGGWSRMDYQIS